LQIIRTNLLRVLLVAWCGLAAVAGLDYIVVHGWAGAFGTAGTFGGYYGTIAALTMLPGGVLHWLCLMVISRRVSNWALLRLAALALSPLVGMTMYLALREGVSDRGRFLAVALGLSTVYGLIVRLPSRR